MQKVYLIERQKGRSKLFARNEILHTNDGFLFVFGRIQDGNALSMSTIEKLTNGVKTIQTVDWCIPHEDTCLWYAYKVSERMFLSRIETLKQKKSISNLSDISLDDCQLLSKSYDYKGRIRREMLRKGLTQ